MTTLHIKDGVIRYVPDMPLPYSNNFIPKKKGEYETALSKALEGSIEFDEQSLMKVVSLLPQESLTPAGIYEIQLGEVEIVRQAKTSGDWFDIPDGSTIGTNPKYYRTIARLKGKPETGTLEWAISEMSAGHKVTHEYYDAKEWTTIIKGEVVHEDGVGQSLVTFKELYCHKHFKKGWSKLNHTEHPVKEESQEQLWDEIAMKFVGYKGGPDYGLMVELKSKWKITRI